MKDMVVIVPGLMGSVLSKGGQTLWGESYLGYLQDFLQAGARQNPLILGEDRHDGALLSDDVEAVDLVGNYRVLDRFFATPGYSDLLNRLLGDDRLNLQLGLSLHKFPYDWRRSVRHAAHVLKTRCQHWLENWRSESGNGQAKIIFLSHSMGGLVCRYFLEVLEGWRDCHSLITFGTPHRGSLQPLQYVVEGYKLKGRILLTDLARSCTSTYELMARYPCIQADGAWHRIEDIDVGGRRLTQARDLHSELDQALARNKTLPGYDYALLPVIGTSQTTQMVARYDNGGLVFSPQDSRLPTLAGDGTVSQLGALPPEFNEGSAWFMGTHHTELPVAKASLEHVVSMLVANQFDPKNFLGSGCFTLDSEDSFEAAQEPLSFRVTVANRTPARLTIINLETGEKVFQAATDLYPSQNFSHQVETPGIYRISVSSADNSVAPCSKAVLVY